MRIDLYNRDHAEIYLEMYSEKYDGTSLWKLKVDPKHDYCLQYMRMGGDFDILENNKILWKHIQMIDPSGGPYLEVGDELQGGRYKIIEFLDATTVKLSERNNNNKEYPK